MQTPLLANTCRQHACKWKDSVCKAKALGADWPESPKSSSSEQEAWHEASATTKYPDLRACCSPRVPSMLFPAGGEPVYGDLSLAAAPAWRLWGGRGRLWCGKETQVSEDPLVFGREVGERAAGAPASLSVTEWGIEI